MKKFLTKIFRMVFCNRGVIFFLSLVILSGCVTVPRAPVVEVGRKKAAVAHEAPRYLRYIVQRGDTLWEISHMAYNDSRKWRKILNANRDRIKNTRSLKPGEIINIPIE